MSDKPTPMQALAKLAEGYVYRTMEDDADECILCEIKAPSVGLDDHERYCPITVLREAVGKAETWAIFDEVLKEHEPGIQRQLRGIADEHAQFKRLKELLRTIKGRPLGVQRKVWNEITELCKESEEDNG